MKRKIAAIILAALMMFSVIPFSASAADSNFLYDAIFDDDSYYHLEYVEAEDYFEDDIAWATALGGVEDWAEYFEGNQGVSNAEAILLGLIEKIDAEYQNELAEEIITALEYAKTATDVVNTINKYTGILDFAESAEWADSVAALGTVIKIANYSNELYEKYVEGYARILSAKAASTYYGDFLDYIATNCDNAAVKAAAAKIKANIDAPIEDAIDALAAELAVESANDLAGMGIDVAMNSYSVTAAINTAYGVIKSGTDKILNLQTKKEYQLSLAEICKIEDCIDAWVDAAIADDDANFEGFAVSAFITIRQTGEDLLTSLAASTDSALIAYIKDYNTEALKVRAALASAKLGVIRDILASDNTFAINAGIAVTGNSDVIFQNKATLENDYTIADGAASVAYNSNGVFACVENVALGQYIKVAYLFAGNSYDALICGAAASGKAYVALDSAATGAFDTYYGCVGLASKRTVSVIDTATWNAGGATLPTFTVEDSGMAAVEGTLKTEFSVNVDPIAAVTDDTNTGNGGGSTSGGSTSGGSSSSGNKGGSSFGDIFKAFFQSIIDAFKSIFKIFG